MSWRLVSRGVLALAVACSAAVPQLWHRAEKRDPVILASTALPASCGNSSNGCSSLVRLQGGAKILVYRNFPFAGSSSVRSALVVVHGSGRNPVSTFTGMMHSVGLAGASQSTMVLAPQFKTSADGPASGEGTWTDDGWKEGAGAVQPKGLSSFTVMDELITTLADRSRFPNLTRITVVGHSAGGQFTQRYAAFGLAPNRVSGVAINYVVANPSSYVYLDSTRPDNAGAGFSKPATSCAGYNNYKYGLQGRSGYVGQLTDQQVIANYTSRRITYLQGGSDTLDEELDMDCGAMLEGRNRLKRGTSYFAHMRSSYPNAPQNRVVVPSIGHDHYDLFDSPLARSALFGVTAAADQVVDLPAPSSG
jgi:hypothetical protein